MRLRGLLPADIPTRLLVRGLVGTALIALSGPGAGAVPIYKDAVASLLHLDWIHESPTLRVVSALTALLGMVLLASAWWRLRPLLTEVRPRSVALAAALWSLPLLIATPLFSRDVYAYAGQGNLVAHDIDPYTYGPNALRGKWADNVDGVWRDTPSPYGPLWLWLAGRIVWLSQDHLVPALFMLRLMSVIGLVLIAVALPLLARDHGVPAQRALWLGLANPFVLIHSVGGAHNDALMIGLMVGGLAIAGQNPSWRRLVAAAVLITLAALIKVPALAALGFLPMALHTWPSRLRAAALITSVTAVTATFVATSTGLGWGWLGTLTGGSTVPSIFSPLTGLGVAVGHALESVGIVNQAGTAIRLVFTIGLVVAVAVAIALLARARSIGPMRALGLMLIAVVALAPIVQPWYLLWGLVLLAAVGGPRVALALGALSVALCLSLLPNGKSVVRPPWYGAPLLAAMALAAFEVRRATRAPADPAPESTEAAERPLPV